MASPGWSPGDERDIDINQPHEKRCGSAVITTAPVLHGDYKLKPLSFYIISRTRKDAAQPLITGNVMTKIPKSALIIGIVGIGLIIYGVLTLTADPVRDDLKHYINDQISSLREVEKKSVGTYMANIWSYEGPNFAGILQDKIIPGYREYLNAVKAIEPETDEVKKIHALLVEAVEEQNEALINMHEAIRTNSRGMRAKAENDLRAAALKNENWLSALRKLGREHKLNVY